jgi:hypothetical protein
MQIFSTVVLAGLSNGATTTLLHGAAMAAGVPPPISKAATELVASNVRRLGPLVLDVARMQQTPPARRTLCGRAIPARAKISGSACDRGPTGEAFWLSFQRIPQDFCGAWPKCH